MSKVSTQKFHSKATLFADLKALPFWQGLFLRVLNPQLHEKTKQSKVVSIKRPCFYHNKTLRKRNVSTCARSLNV